MSCPQIYLGSGRASAFPPLAADTTNDSIVPPTDHLVSGVPVNVQITVHNHGTDPTPTTDLELYWTTPGTYAAPVNFVGTYPFAAAEILSAVSFPPTEAATTRNFAWTPSTVGHFCLFARLKNTAAPAGACLEQQYGADPLTDPLSAIHCVEVIGPGGADGEAGQAGASGTNSEAGEGGVTSAGGVGNTNSGGSVGSRAGASNGGAPQAGESNGGMQSGGSGNGGTTAPETGGTSAATGGTNAAGTSSSTAEPGDSGCGCRLGNAEPIASGLLTGFVLCAVVVRRRFWRALRRP